MDKPPTDKVIYSAIITKSLSDKIHRQPCVCDNIASIRHPEEGLLFVYPRLFKTCRFSNRALAVRQIQRVVVTTSAASILSVTVAINDHYVLMLAQFLLIVFIPNTP